MTITKDKRTGTWKARVTTVDGKTKTVSTRETEKAKATRILRQSRIAEFEEAAKAGKLQLRGVSAILGTQKVTVPMAVENFVEWLRTNARSELYAHQSKGVLSAFVSSLELENVLIPDVTERHVYDFVNNPHNQNKASWRKVKLSILNSFFDLVSARGWRTGNPARCVRVQKSGLSHAQKETKPRHPFTDKEVDKLLALTPSDEFWHAAIAIARYTGLRLGDVAQLEWDCLSVAGKIIVWTDKRDRRVALPIQPDELILAIAAIKRVHPKYVFPSERNIYKDLNSRANLSTYFRRLCLKAGIEGKTFHDLRSSFLSDAAKRGVPIEHIAASAGHVSTATTRRYIKPME